MALWCIKGGRNGEREQRMIERSIVAIGWQELGDLSVYSDKEALMTKYQDAFPDAERRRVAHHVGQLWSFVNRIKINDLVVVPLKTQSAIAIGEFKSDYLYSEEYGQDMRHIRKVEWFRTDLPRNTFDQDLLYSFGAFMTVCQITRNDAERRVRALLRGEQVQPLDEEEIDDQSTDVEQIARDQILKHISQKYRGHELARLVESVLSAQGMTVERMNPGPDGGVDILAGSGAMGFDSPRICVQVKSSDTPVGVEVFRALKGTMDSFSADQGLLVSLGGFKNSTLNEALTSFFRVRLWDSGDLINLIIRYYDQLPDTVQAEIPLKKVWALALEED